MNGRGSHQEVALRQVLRLVDLSRDLDRNRDDSNFSNTGGEIIYVLDENIFEIFVRPFRHSESVETFYSDIWSAEGRADSSWRSFESQAALVASEFLLSKPLPGSRRGIVSMTAPHRWELAHRVDDLAKEFRRRLEQNDKRISDELAKKFAVLANLMAGDGETRIETQSVDDVILAQDLERLRKTGKSDVTVSRIRAARIAAEVLANDDFSEPVDQLRRIVTFPIRAKLRTIDVNYQPHSKDNERIEADARFWFMRLLEELKRPGNKLRRRANQAAPKALWNDARSIAFLLWLSRERLNSDQRLAFVTGDMVLFDAYRRWHSTAAPHSSPSTEPFIMRRATQYSPIFNPHDIGGDLSLPEPLGSGNLFSLIQQAVEASLLPLTLSLSSRDPRDQGANRELLALKAIDLETLSDDSQLALFSAMISDQWLANHYKRITEIRDLWQETQRIAIGSSYDLISARLSGEQRDIIGKMVSSTSTDAALLLNGYVARLLDRLIDDSIELWLPLAKEFLLSEPESPAKRFAPTVRLVEALAKDGVDQVPDSRQSPQSVFAQASLHALQKQDTSNATRFSGLALRAGDPRPQGDGPSALDLELQYLAAVTHTVDIGSYAEHLRPKATALVRSMGLRRAKQSYAQASTLLYSCLSNHFSGREQTKDTFHAIRYLRALSERASLNLFMAASIGLSVKIERQDGVGEANKYLQIAKGDLLLCLKEGRSLRGELMDAIRRKNLINIAAAEVLAYIFASETGYRFDERFKQHIAAVQRQAEATKEPHALLVAELTAFFYLADREGPKSFGIHRFRERDLWQEAAHLRLPLDRALFIAIQRHVIGRDIGASKRFLQ